MNTRDMAKFCHWMLTMSEVEAAYISSQVKPYSHDKEKVAAFTTRYYMSRRGQL